MDPVQVFKSLGLIVRQVDQAKEYLHLSISPQQGGPQLELVKPDKDSKIYVLGMGVGIHQYHQSQLKSMNPGDRKDFLSNLRYRLMRMRVDVGFTPPNEEIPQLIFLSRVLYDEDLTENDVLDAMYKVRNAGTLVIFMFTDRFGVPQPTTKYM
ncbi:DUF2299 domain-containing protein [Metallosphaera hakonensis]|uniref:DUF2299 domain-containing protein n=1 Tax=Metallosphaera hakonensis JCM 8857 = DSM 7519 TaxID=1293036 RepID=A0A2U9IWD0_9CREN|nr:DUF2299 domain-containing protein [Metallosphaera hakonensis]AWS00273.1 DUF2299 domain-containing protein [Metallosphaera hakonensis JCM 8857 = DSM 7519]